MQFPFCCKPWYLWIPMFFIPVFFNPLPVQGQNNIILFDEPFRDGVLPEGWEASLLEFNATRESTNFLELNSELISPVIDLAGLVNVRLELEVANYSIGPSGIKGPLTIDFSDDGGVTWNAQSFNSPSPQTSEFESTGSVYINLSGDNVRMRITRPYSETRKSLRDLTLTATDGPYIHVGPDTLAGFTTGRKGEASASQSFPVSAINFPDEGQLTITGSESFEISLDDFTFSDTQAYSFTGGSFTGLDVYVRLKSGLAGGDRHEAVTLSYADAEVYSWVSGTVIPTLSGNGYTQDFSAFISLETLPPQWTTSSSTYAGDWGLKDEGLKGNAGLLGYQTVANRPAFTASVVLNNATGKAIENLNISYEGMVTRTYSTVHPEWTVSVNGTVAEVLRYSTGPGVDTWIQASLTGLSIGEGEDVTVTWSSPPISGSGARRQIGFTDVAIAPFDGDAIHQARLTGAEGFRMISVPAASNYRELLSTLWTQGMANAATESGDPNIWTWDPAPTGPEAGNWKALTDLDTPITPGTGFLAYIYEKDEKAGGSGSFPKIITVPGSEPGLPLSMAANPNPGGFTLFGNPTSSALAWDDLSRTGLDDVVYLWDPNAGLTGAWVSWSGGAGDLTGGLIRPFQAFFSMTAEGAENPSLEFTELAKGQGGRYFGKQSTQEPISIRLHLEGRELSSSAWLRFSTTGRSGHDPGDAYKLQPLNNHYARLATHTSTGTPLDINNLPYPKETLEIPLSATTTKPGGYTISIGDVPEFGEVILFDQFLNKKVILNEGMIYEFTIEGALRKNGALSTERGALRSEKVSGLESMATDPRFSLFIQGKDEEPAILPAKLKLTKNYPNPFNPITKIRYELPEAGVVRLAVYDLLGREVAVLASGSREAGIHQVSWDARAAASGMYIYRLEAYGRTLTGKMTLIK
ncbi:MAG: T9SS type A sorting domain-containing protein [Balneolales bacterium]